MNKATAVKRGKGQKVVAMQMPAVTKPTAKALAFDLAVQKQMGEAKSRFALAEMKKPHPMTVWPLNLWAKKPETIDIQALAEKARELKAAAPEKKTRKATTSVFPFREGSARWIAFEGLSRGKKDDDVIDDIMAAGKIINRIEAGRKLWVVKKWLEVNNK